MTTTTRVQITGLRELGQAMRLLSDDVSLRICRAATAAAAKVIKDKAIANAPQSEAPHQLGRRNDQIVQPGNLKRNIIVKRIPKSEASGLTSEHIVTVRHGSGKVPNDAFYGRFVEFGTVKMGPKPFLAPAFISEKEAAAQAMQDRIEARIAKASK